MSWSNYPTPTKAFCTDQSNEINDVCDVIAVSIPRTQRALVLDNNGPTQELSNWVLSDQYKGLEEDDKPLDRQGCPAGINSSMTAGPFFTLMDNLSTSAGRSNTYIKIDDPSTSAGHYPNKAASEHPSHKEKDQSAHAPSNVCRPPKYGGDCGCEGDDGRRSLTDRRQESSQHLPQIDDASPTRRTLNIIGLGPPR